MIRPSCLSVVLLVLCSTPFVWSQFNDLDAEWTCPQYWVQFGNSCYKFVKSPIRPRNEAHRNCKVCTTFNNNNKYIQKLLTVSAWLEVFFFCNIQEFQWRVWFRLGVLYPVEILVLLKQIIYYCLFDLIQINLFFLFLLSWF